MKWISAQWRSLATVVVCAAYVVFWFRNNLDNANTLMGVVITGVLALGSFVYSVFSPNVHHRVTKILAGCGALVATFTAGAFLYYAWSERRSLQDIKLMGMVLFFSALACGAAVVAWIIFCRCNWSAPCETTAPSDKSTATT